MSFEEIRNGGESRCAIETMFEQRAARFKAMGVADPFKRDKLLDFYHDAIRPESGLDVRLHVLRLDGEIVAIRYNVVHGDRMFCLISSMSTEPSIQGGSPGKQCLLRVMQTVFDAGFRVFDMGAGFHRREAALVQCADPAAASLCAAEPLRAGWCWPCIRAFRWRGRGSRPTRS